ncbi:MAG: hypothetical protein C4576_06760 [Desulfobacteraceae bacterium]|nr:MAG: hypothetical protein C4576_06760 [Desulfobacteraceae bacterium]
MRKYFKRWYLCATHSRLTPVKKAAKTLKPNRLCMPIKNPDAPYIDIHEVNSPVGNQTPFRFSIPVIAFRLSISLRHCFPKKRQPRLSLAPPEKYPLEQGKTWRTQLRYY